MWQPVGAGGLGVGQQWYNVEGSRALGVTYTNTTSKPIMIAFDGYAGAGYVEYYFYVNSIYISNAVCTSVAPVSCTTSFVVPSGYTYRISGNGGAYFVKWSELR